MLIVACWAAVTVFMTLIVWAVENSPRVASNCSLWQAAKIVSALTIVGCVVHLAVRYQLFVPLWALALFFLAPAYFCCRRGLSTKLWALALLAPLAAFVWSMAVVTITGTMPFLFDGSGVVVSHGPGGLSDHPVVLNEPGRTWGMNFGYSTWSRRVTALPQIHPTVSQPCPGGVLVVAELDQLSALDAFGQDAVTLERCVQAAMVQTWADTHPPRSVENDPAAMAQFHADFEQRLPMNLAPTGLVIDKITWDTW
jgi:hypothetical protein